MNCTTFEAWLQETADRRGRTLPDEAARHIAGCDACGALWTTESRLDAAIEAWKLAPLPIVSAAALVEQVIAEQHSPAPIVAASAARHSSSRTASRQLAWFTVATALAVLFVMGLTLSQLAGPDSSPIQTARQVDLPETEVPLSESVAALWNDVRFTSHSVARETVESLDEWSQLPATSLPAAAVDRTTVPTAPAWVPWSEPIGENVNTGFGFLGDLVPMPTAG